MVTEYSTNREYLEDIASHMEIKSYSFKHEDTVMFNHDSQTLNEAAKKGYFWNSLFHEFKEDVEKIEFFYKEKDKELPLSPLGNLAKKIGFNITPKIQEGEVKKTQVHPITINKNFPILNVIASKENWERLNAIWNNGGEGFSAPHILTVEPLCYRVNLPLENIAEVKFKSYNFLNKQYQKKQNVSQTRINQ